MIALIPHVGWSQMIGHVDVKAVSPRDIAADTSGVFDEVASGLNVVGVGEKVYLGAEPLHGFTIGGAQWELTGRPTGSNATLSDTEGTLITLVVDAPGLYLVRMTALTPELVPSDPVEQRVYAGTWVGAGTFNTHGAPDSTIPSCANACCHSESTEPRLNVADRWLGTNHATKLQTHLQGMRGAEYEVSCLPCHSLGFKDTAVNGGFDDIAAHIGFDLGNIVDLIHDAATNGTDNWPALPSELQRHASIQCESCHGPGSQHLGHITEADHGIGGVNFEPDQCAQCHDTDQHFDNGFYQWNTSTHPITAELSEGHVADSDTCRKCHTAEGFVYGVVKNQPIPQMDAHDYHSVTCSTCHDPHGSDNPNQLRLSGSATLPSGAVYADAGKGGLCMNCHNTRSTNGENTAQTSFRGAHYGAQANVLLGEGMAKFGLTVSGNSAHTTITEDTCVTCHMADSDTPVVGGHTYSMRALLDPNDPNSEVINAENACATCHAGLDSTYDRTARGDYDGNGMREGVQTEVKGLLAVLRTGLLTFPGTSQAGGGYINITGAGFNALTPDQKSALYNFNLIAKDGSYGVHNTAFAVQALQRSYFGVYGRSILNDFPDIDLRGPVQPSTVVTPTPSPTPVPTATPQPTPVPEFLAEIRLLNVSPRTLGEDTTGMLTEVSSGLRSVGIGELVYMEAVKTDDTVTTYTWSVLSRPAGSVAALSDVTGEQVTFRPDAKGTYLVRLTPHTTGKAVIDVYDQRIYAAEWVGVGTFNPDDAPRAPECGTSFCHGGNSGNPELNVLADWLKSNHSQVLEAHMNGDRGAVYDLSMLVYHTLGMNEHPAAVNSGFDDLAASLGFDLDQIPALVADAAANGNDNFMQLPVGLRGHGSVQCESCHGAGSQHPPNLSSLDKGIDGANLSGQQCAQCHDSTPEVGIEYHQWMNTGHPISTMSTSSVTGSDTCRTCHTGEGFIATRVNNEPIPQLESSEYHGITCVVCHDPHSSESPHQLRVDGDFTIPSGDRPYNSGTGGICFRCHNSRIADPEATALSSTRGAHYGPQADIMLGAGGVSFGLGFVEDFPHGTVVEDSCVACHMADASHEEMGGHSFGMSVEGEDGEITNVQNACATCHIGLDSYDRTAGGDYDGDGAVEGIQTEVAGLFDLLRPGILAISGTSLSSSGYVNMTNGGFAAMTADQKSAVYNFNIVWKDGSQGIHNPSYAVQLLQRSYFGVYGHSILQDFPAIALRGPVQDIEQGTSAWFVK